MSKYLLARKKIKGFSPIIDDTEVKANLTWVLTYL